MTKSKTRTLILAAFLVITVALLYFIVNELVEVYDLGRQHASQGR